ncbi:MAG: acyltransferase [Prevotella sp.]|nr:acyltransferase [Prevotella sp.]
MNRNNIYLASKPRYEILDGLRGVAALLVVAFHLFETYSEGPSFQIINHGYLAVDFFFVLSGFVIGYAYDDRWDSMSTWNFFKRRLVRLHPMVMMGAFVGLLLFYFGGGPGFELIGQTPWWKVLLLFLIACTMIPVSAGMDIRGWAETYPLNGATWSLMLEYIANILYALVIRRLSKAALSVLVVVFGCLTVMLCLDIDPLGVLESRDYAAYTVIGGWGIDATQLWIGFTRLLYPFFCGLLVSRAGRFITVRGGFWVCVVLVAACQLMPHVGGTDEANFWMNGIYEAVCILFVFPLVVAMGAGSRVTDRYSQAVCRFLGEISYPLYITHYPLVYLQMSWAASHADAPLGQHVMVAVSLWLMAVGMAYAALRLYDEPVRAWLRRKWFSAA